LVNPEFGGERRKKSPCPTLLWGQDGWGNRKTRGECIKKTNAAREKVLKKKKDMGKGGRKLSLSKGHWGDSPTEGTVW